MSVKDRVTKNLAELGVIPGAQIPMRFDGETYNPILDRARLGAQAGRVWDTMSDGVWRTLAVIAYRTGDPEASVSARLRDFRKSRFGSHVVERRRKGKGRGGTWEYRLIAL